MRHVSFIPLSLPSPPSFLSLSAHVKVSYISSAPDFSDNRRFPYHVRVEPSGTVTQMSLGIIAAQFGWEEVTWIVQSEEVFVSVSQTVKLSSS